MAKHWYSVDDAMRIYYGCYDTPEQAIRASAEALWRQFPDSDPRTVEFTPIDKTWGRLAANGKTYRNIMLLDDDYTKRKLYDRNNMPKWYRPSQSGSTGGVENLAAMRSDAVATNAHNQ